MSRRKKDIATEFFDKSEDRAVGFEIALAALLATACLSFIIPGREASAKMIAMLLLVITLVRRANQASPYSPEAKIDRWTPSIVEIAAALSMIYLTAAAATYLNGILAVASPILIFGLLGIILTLVLALGQELVFRDYLVWWHAKFGQKHEDGDFPKDVWQFISVIAYRFSRAVQSRESYQNIPKSSRYEISWDDIVEQLSIAHLAGRVLVAIVFLATLYSPALMFGGYSVGLSTVIVVPAIVFLHDHTAFWFVAYGNTSYEDLRYPWYWLSVSTALYLVFIVYLLGELPSLPFI